MNFPSRTISHAVLLVALSAVVALEVGAQAVPQSSGKPLRTMAKGDWQVVRVIGLDTDLLDQPFDLEATSDRVIVADAGDQTIKSIKLTGELEWKFGGAGSGPGEFREIQDLSLDPFGNVLVYDRALERLTVIDRGGKLRATTRLRSRAERVLFGGASGNYLLLTASSDTFARVVDTTGRIVRPFVPLPPDTKRASAIAREMSSVLPLGTGSLVTFRWSSRILVLRTDGSVAHSCMAVDSLSFPPALQLKLKANLGEFKNLRADRVDPRARQASVTATLFAGALAVKPPTSKGKVRLLDIYAPNCGPYRESRPFPFAAFQIAGNQQFLTALVLDPSPHIVVLQWVPKQP